MVEPAIADRPPAVARQSRQWQQKLSPVSANPANGCGCSERQSVPMIWGHLAMSV